jgi:1A family penicillin-binding protein
MAVPLPPARMPEGTDVFDMTGARVARLFTEDRTMVSLEQVSPQLVQAVIAIEDRFFRSHFGVNPGAAARAVWQAIRQGRIVSGFSTITQQLARNLYLTADRSMRRKMLEMLWAVKIDLHWSKDRILEAYLNEVYWGHGVYGVEEAARTYFGKSAAELDLPEAALLAGMLQSPETYSPYNNRDAAAKRREVVLNRLAQDGRITPEEAAAAAKTPIKLIGLKPRGKAAYFVQYCVAQIGARHPELVEDLYRRNYRIYTTLDSPVQAAAEKAVADDLTEGLPDVNGILQPQVAAVAVEPATGFIRMMIGGRDYSESTYNRAVDARRQPGSTFKPFVYAAAVERGYTPADTQLCAPRVFAAAGSDGYSPHDYGSQEYHNRELTMREAVARSCNVSATAWLETVGANRVIGIAQRSGIVSPLAPTPSLALGCYEVSPLELCAAYATLAAGGLRASPVGVLRIVGPDGEVIEEYRPEPAARAMRAGTAYIVTDLLKGVLRPGGTGAGIGARITRPAAAKTGSTEGYRDAWFAGYTPTLSVVVWVGHDNPTELAGGGAALAGPIWRETVQTGLKGRRAPDFVRPAEVVSIAVCSETGLRANWTCEQTEDLCLSDLAPAEYCSAFHWPDIFGLKPRSPEEAAPPGTPGEPVTPAPSKPGKPRRR